MPVKPESPTKRKATMKDLRGYGLMAWRHWRKHRPIYTKDLEQRGEFLEAILQAQEAAEDTYNRQLAATGNATTAAEVAEREWILLPDAREDPAEGEPDEVEEDPIAGDGFVIDLLDEDESPVQKSQT